MIRFVHTADLHLDSPFKGIKAGHPELFDKIHQATFQAFRKIVTFTIEKKADFLLVCGDIYDEENQSVKAQAFFRDEMKRLEAADIPVFLLHGNHDFMGREALQLQMPANVKVFGPTPETFRLKTKGSETVAVTGFSYPTRWVKERMIEQYPKHDGRADYHIGMLHGFMDGLESAEGVYAPFSIADLLEKNYHYWALGHIHKKEVLHQEPNIIYPGNTQGRNPNEQGGKGAYLVELQKGSTSEITFFPSAPIEWIEEKLSLKGISSLAGLMDEVESLLKETASGDKEILLSIQLDDYDELSKEVLSRIETGDLLEGINQSNHELGIYLYRMTFTPQKDRLFFQYDKKMQASFDQSKEDLSKEERFRDVLGDFFKNQIVRSRFSDFESDEMLKEEILQAAENLLREEIAFEEGEE